MSKNKCKGCQWYNKPYWGIINPCDNCPREEANIQILTRWQDPIIEELKSQLQQKENVIKEVREYIEHENFKRNILVGVSTKKYTRDILNKILEILDKEVN